MTTSGHTLLRNVTFQPTAITAEAVERFVDLGEVVAHAVLTALGRQLLVRIKVSARAEYERYQRLARIAGSSVEVDLSGLSLEQINDPAVFERAVLSDPDTRSWIRSLRGEMLEQRAAKDLAAEVVAHDAQWEQEQGRLQAIENERREKQEAEASARAIALAAHRKAQLAAAEAQRVIGIPAKDERGARQRREELIVGQTLRASQEWGGRAVECSACYILSPPGTQFCLYCANENSTISLIFVPADVMTTIQSRMRSSAKPDRSLRMVPTLLVQPEPFTMD
ncbi:hypothetical protein [Geopseudomonas aromaticivorans]